MTIRKRVVPSTAPEVASPMYAPGEKIRVLRGKYKGQVMTVRECTKDEVFLVERPGRESMSKGNLERVS